jgi:hypothetical protein
MKYARLGSVVAIAVAATAIGMAPAQAGERSFGDLVTKARPLTVAKNQTADDPSAPKLLVRGKQVLTNGQEGVSLTLPSAPVGASAKPRNGGFDTVVLGTANDFSVNVVIKDSSAPTSYDFRFALRPGERLLPTEDGGAVIATKGGDSVAYGYYARILAPWAVDAAGRGLPTHYEVHGATLRQVVDTRDAVFPVVADPNVKTVCSWWSCDVFFSRWYTKNVLQPTLSSSGAAGILAGAALCGQTGPAFAACAVAVTIAWLSLLGTINLAANGNACFVVNYPYIAAISPGAIKWRSNNSSTCQTR